MLMQSSVIQAAAHLDIFTSLANSRPLIQCPDMHRKASVMRQEAEVEPASDRKAPA